MTMRVAIVGASGAGLYAALFLKKRHPDYDVTVFDQASKVGKKLLATGNGHCNLLNLQMAGKYYNDPGFVDALLERCPLSSLQQTLADFGIATLHRGDLVYPLSYSAASYVRYLHSTALRLGVKFVLGAKVCNYQVNEQITLELESGKETFDKVVFATGGASSPNLGSDGSLFPVFARHGYEIIPLAPSLCPLVTKEKTKRISGLRHEAKITLFSSGKTIYEEAGEILFKDDGISGIAVFNASAYIARESSKDYEVVVDLFPTFSEQEIGSLLERAKRNNPQSPYGAVMEEKLAEYVEFAGKMQGLPTFSKAAKNLKFHVSGLYPFASSQVSHGGIKVDQIGLDFASKKENGVYFLGEVLNVDGLCGGLNLGFALASAKTFAESL